MNKESTTYFTTEEFDDKFEPYTFGDNDEVTFNTLDDLKKFAKENNLPHTHQYIWTAVDGDTKPILVNGFHYVNRFGYVLCKNHWGFNDARDNTIYLEAEY